MPVAVEALRLQPSVANLAYLPGQAVSQAGSSIPTPRPTLVVVKTEMTRFTSSCPTVPVASISPRQVSGDLFGLTTAL
jgi:hypothetical protein